MTEAEVADSKRRILEAAAQIAAESGYEGTTISKVVKRSGLPVSSVYWFFKDKDDLLAEVVRASFETWLAEQPTWDPLPKGVSVGEGLRAVLGRSVLSLAAAPDFIRIGMMLTLEGREVEPAARAIFLEMRIAVEDDIAGWFTKAIGARKVKRAPELPRQLARIVIAGTDGLFLAHQIHDVESPDEFVDILASIVESAIAAA
ncbi:TetR family transcriptional regulator [Nocardioides sp. Root1257]|uniref:TetR/AcrR family transcriptional regulator n=1 Tax=unclassified Nocardioides TaxID=2615069 RepID=UPI00070229F4|nr:MULTISPECIES: TetR/AcrR family transcriptional regulator [unclassified Nocardioides]KQW47383.1 TetR family transcriptional regulator [Nocardioides sp. Root1257]KRC45539.1 TetR family transcriptional regulator [Nocardioides sp. Root224]